MLSLYTKTNKMLVQATDIDKQMWEVLCGWFFIIIIYFGNTPSSQNTKPNQDAIWFFESGRVLKAMILSFIILKH